MSARATPRFRTHGAARPTRSPRRLAASVAALLLAAGSIGARAEGRRTAVDANVERQVTAAPVDLRVDAPIAREITKGAVQQFRAALDANQFARIVVEQGGQDLAVTITGPDGATIVDIDGRWHGPEPVSFVADRAGVYHAAVRAVESLAAPVRFETRLAARREPRPGDEDAMAAERAATQGKRFVGQQTADSRRKAIAAYEDALDRWRRAREAFGEAQALNALGFVHNALGENRQAIPRYEQAASIWRDLGYRYGEAETLNNMAAARSALGDKQVALDLLRRSLVLRREVGDARGEASTLTNMSAILMTLGEYRTALDNVALALPLWRGIGDRRGEAQALNARASIASLLGETHEALSVFDDMLDLARSQGDRRSEAIALQNMGSLFMQLGDADRGLSHNRQALDLLRKEGDQRTQAYALLNIAKALEARGEPREAHDAYTEAVSLARRVQDRRVEAIALNDMGLLRYTTGDRASAAERFAEALTLIRMVGDPRTEAAVLGNLGRVTHDAGDHASALDHYGQARTRFQSAGDANGEASALLGVARIARDEQRLEDARVAVEEALSLVESLRTRVASSDLRASYVAAKRAFYEFHIDLLMQLHARRPAEGYDRLALQASERARARSLVEMLNEGRTEIRRHVDATLLEREHALRQQINATAIRQSRLLSGAHTDADAQALRDQLDSLLGAEQLALGQLRAASPRYASLTQPQALRIEDMQALLDEDTVLLEFALGDERSFVWALTTRGLTSAALPPRRDIDVAARRLHGLATTPERTASIERALDVAASALSAMVLGPISGAMGSKRLLIVADGALQYVPFGALPEPIASERSVRSPRLLAAGRELVSLPSATALATIRRDLEQRPSPRKTVAVLADPVFRYDDVRVETGSAETTSATAGVVHRAAAAPRDLQRSISDAGARDEADAFPRLVFTRREADAILRLAPVDGRLRAVDFSANRETATSPALRNYGIVHFATHGLINTVHPELSGLVLSLVDANGAPRDGFLRLQDIYNLDLPSDLVVLSACQTGLGKEIKGEGIVGLTRGFMHAGAARVVVSLWKVDDEATAALMQRFYEGMLGPRRQSPAAALRAAQMALAAQPRWRSPYYWAGFILQGEPR